MPRVQFSLPNDTVRTSKREREEDDPASRLQEKKPRVEEGVTDTNHSQEDGDTKSGGMVIPSEKDLQAAKLQRRELRATKNFSSSEKTQIDENTSLATDGIAIEPFHMRNEENDGAGFFDGDTYIFRRGNTLGIDDEPDAWADALASTESTKIGTKEIKTTKEPQETLLSGASDEELYAKICTLIEGNESVSQALIRYGRKSKRPESGSAKESKAALLELTEMANILLTRGEVDIYQSKRSNILKKVGKEATLGKEAVETFWEYKGSEDGEVHGPYSSETMSSWRNAGYFVADKRVLVRKVSATQPKSVDHSNEEELLNDLMDDSDDEVEKESGNMASEWLWSDKVDFSSYFMPKRQET